jgi:putative ABC transport system permease protein
MGAVGTFFLFASMSGFFLEVISANKRFYYRGLNIFIARQLGSRVNTAYISMTLICLMLLPPSASFPPASA